MGLIKTAATVAVASAVHGRVQRRQHEKWAAQYQAGAAAVPPPPPPCAPGMPATQPYQAPAAPFQSPAPAAAPAADPATRLAQLTQLGDLLKAGVLTEAEFQQEKARILNG